MGAADNDNLLSFVGVTWQAGIGEGRCNARRDRGCAGSAKGGGGVFATTSLLGG